MRVAVIQLEPKLAAIGENLALLESDVRQAAQSGARLVVAPECALSGYMFGSLEEGMSAAETVPGPSVERLCEVARETEVYLIAGMLERDGERLFNTAVLVGPEGYVGAYRKTHVLCLGIDRFATPGDLGYPVFDLPIGRVGIMICYDLRFPEAARALALAGAQIIALPTNWPRSSTIMPELFARSRAAENRVFLLGADRVGTERGAQFLGRSCIIDPTARVLAEAGMDDPEILTADLNLEEAERKHIVFTPGEHEMDLWGDRRPDLYGGFAAAGAE